MGQNHTNGCADAAEGIPRRRPWRIVLLIGVGLILLVGVFFRDKIPGPWRSDDERDKSFPPGVLADYVPADSAAVVTVNVRPLLASPAGRRLEPSLRQLLHQGERRFRWMGLLGISPFDDLDYLQISFAPSSSGQPLWLAHSHLDRSRFQVGPDKLREKNIDHFRALEYADRSSKRTTLLAPIGDALVASETPARVLAALKQASDPQLIAVRDATLREMLQKVDRRQSLWFAASFKNLDPAGAFGDALMKRLLTPLLRHAESAHGGLTCAEDLRAELHFNATTEEDAFKLEEEFKAIRDLAAGAVLFLGRQKELLPLFRLLASAETNRDGKTVSLRCRLTADQLDG